MVAATETAAADMAERLGLPGASPESIVAAQHKLHTRRLLQQIAPAASLPFQDVAMSPTEALPPDLRFPAFVAGQRYRLKAGQQGYRPWARLYDSQQQVLVRGKTLRCGSV